MVELKVNDNNSKGLRIFNNSGFYIYSEIKNTWFSGCKIFIYNNKGFLLLKALEKGLFSEYSIELKDDSFLKGISSIKNRVLQTTIGDFKIKHSWFRIVYPISKIYLNGKEIGKIKTKLISKNRDYKIQFQVKDEIKILYSCILFLITESNQDFAD